MTFTATVIRTTERAILFEIGGFGGHKQWVPRSQVEGGAHIFGGDSIVVEISDWFAEKEGFESYSDGWDQ